MGCGSVKWDYIRHSHIPEIRDIDAASFPSPWSLAQFEQALRPRASVGIVWREYGETVGYMIYEKHKKCIHVSRLAVHPEHLRRGIGSKMLAKLIGQLSAGGRNQIMVEVGDENLPAHLFFQSNGFRCTAVLPDLDIDQDYYLFHYLHRPGTDVVDAAITGITR